MCMIVNEKYFSAKTPLLSPNSVNPRKPLIFQTIVLVLLVLLILKDLTKITRNLLS